MSEKNYCVNGQQKIEKIACVTPDRYGVRA